MSALVKLNELYGGYLTSGHKFRCKGWQKVRVLNFQRGCHLQLSLLVFFVGFLMRLHFTVMLLFAKTTPGFVSAGFDVNAA